MRFIRCLLFVVCLPIFVLASDEGFSKGPVPDWVKEEVFSIEGEPSQGNLQNLLLDKQLNWEEKTLYCHVVTKILTESGLDVLSKLDLTFDPSYQKIVMHDIRVLRDGIWLDRLGNARNCLIQREKRLKDNIYHGHLSLVFFLSDIRLGDILEYSYSCVEPYPPPYTNFSDNFFLQESFSIGRSIFRFLAHPESSFQIRSLNSDIEPSVVDLSESLREWTWEVIDPPIYSYESQEPVWYNLPAQVQMSQYDSWQDVVREISPLYILPEDCCSEEMLALVGSFMDSTEDVYKRALLALRFVQDEVRYLGFADGIGAYKPNNPLKVFEQRYGDCKDKTFLLHALLRLMDISSTPVLVHSKEGRLLPEALPSPFVFDHAILRVEIDGSVFFVDPTISSQGGPLHEVFFPKYEWGLIIADSSSSLEALPGVTMQNPTEIETSYILISEDSADLVIVNIFNGSEADVIRRSLKWEGQKAVSKSYFSDIQKTYKGTSMKVPMEVLDDKENNILTITESYSFPLQLDVFEIFSTTLRYYLNDRVGSERSSPLALSYPHWIREHIHIENPFAEWDPILDEYSHEHESLYFSQSKQIDEKSADFYFELKHLQDHVPENALGEYSNIVNDIGGDAFIDMSVAGSQNKSTQ